MDLSHFLDTENTRQLLKAYSDATGVHAAVINNNGALILEVGAREICTRFHRVNPDSGQRCIQHCAPFKLRMQESPGRLLESTCGNGMTHIAVPILFAGRQQGAIVIGQFFPAGRKPDVSQFVKRADEFGFNRDAYIESMEKVPVFSCEQVDAIVRFFQALAKVLAETGSDSSKRKIEELPVPGALEKPEITLRMMIEAVPMLVIGTDRKVILWNRALEKLTGIRADDMIGTERAWTAFYESERPLLAELLADGCSDAVPTLYQGSCTKSGLLDDAYEGIGHFPHCGEKGRWLHFTAAPLTDSRGKLVGAMETFQDVTEREVAETKWRTVYKSLPGGSFTVNDRYEIEEVNDVLCSVTGYKREELVGQLCGIICPKGPHLCPIFDLGKDRIDNDETAVKARDGRRVPIIKSAIRINAGDREIIIENFQDITDRKQLEEQLRHSQKMEAVGRLAGGVAHDFNNILTAIIGYANLIQVKTPEESPLTKYTDRIIASAERAATLTRGLLAFSRKDIVDLGLIRVNEIIEKSEKLLSRLIPEDIELRISTGESVVVRADSVQVEQVLMNLVTNARDAMPEGGRLMIAAEPVDLDEEFVRMNGGVNAGKYVVITVSDTGTGIEEKIRERIFEPFYTTKEVGKGTGLGLSIVYGIIKQHGGFIDVSSEPGEGAAFKLYLPAICGSVDETRKSAFDKPPHGTETILVAEDEPMVRDITRSILEEHGYSVIEAEDGVAAVDKFKKNKELISLTVLDIIMPKKNGKEAYYEIKQINPDIKALFLSGYTDDILSSRGIMEEDLDLMCKPIMQNDFLHKVREILDKRLSTAPVENTLPASSG
jgi:PAS domain S-box-containing protein